MVVTKQSDKKPERPGPQKSPAEQESEMPGLTHLLRGIMSDRTLCGKDAEFVRVLPLEWLVANPGDAAGEHFCANCVARFHRMR